jgi:dienelactone hydrolase
VAGTYERTLDVGISGAETQARDLEVARSEAERALSWRPEREAILGMSFGGLSELCYAVRHAELAAIVSLDGGAGGPPGAATIRQSPWFDPGRITAALLHLYQPEGADVAFFEALRYAPRGLVRFAGLRHVDFSGAGGFEAVLAPAADRAAGRRARERAEVWRVCRRFLENALAGRASPFAGLALDPAAGEVKLLEPLPAPPQLEELRALARTRGFPAIEEVYRRFAPRDPAPLSEETCRRLGGWLLDNGKGTDARDLFALQVAMYPGSARARYLLGTAEARLGDRDAARRTLSRALELLATDASLDLASRQRIECAAREALGTQ